MPIAPGRYEALDDAVRFVPRHVAEPDPSVHIHALEPDVVKAGRALPPPPVGQLLLRAIPEVLAARPDRRHRQEEGGPGAPRGPAHRRRSRSRISPSSRTSSGGSGGAAGAAASCRRIRLIPLTRKNSAIATARKAMIVFRKSPKASTTAPASRAALTDVNAAPAGFRRTTNRLLKSG